MQNLPADIFSVASVREIDRSAIEDHGVPGYTLMTRAGAAAVGAARERFPSAARWQVVCGAGNNGGDGYVVARLAAREGIVVSAIALVDPQRQAGDAARAYEDFAAEGGVVLPWEGRLDAEAEILVDGILGSGLERDVSGEFADAVRAINAHGAPVVALDIPTGIHGDTGAVLGCAVRADLTITFVGLKSGLFLGDGRAYCGALRFAGLGIPSDYYRHVLPAYRRIGDDLLAAALPRRPRSAHKGDFGHVLVIGGGEGMPGAVRLAGEAALRTGAGLVSVATHPSHAAILVASRPEIMSHGVDNVAQLGPLVERADVVAFGPGLGQSAWARDIFGFVAGLQKPCAWDADALNLLAEEPGAVRQRVITPHPGEAARLLGRPTAEIQADRVAAAAELQAKFGGVAVLKGAGTIVCSGDGLPPLVCTAGNPGMAAPGMGDVLTGVIGALLAQGLGPRDAAAVGVEAHARAGDIAARRGERGLLASDLLAELRTVVNP